MVIVIDDFSEIPIYQQIRNQIVVGISNGQLLPGEKLPTVRSLATQIGINVMTVNKAYQMLKQEGYIVTERRNGVCVAEKFTKNERLSQQSEERLKQIVSEAKICGITQDSFIEKCIKYYNGD